MLILTRKIGEKIVIGNDIIIELTGIGDKKVKLGIDAPRSVEVLRKEIYDERKKNECLD